MRKLVVFDPGLTTGCAVFRILSQVAQLSGYREYNLQDDYQCLKWLVRTGDVILHESITPKVEGFDCSGIEFIGVLRYLCLIEDKPLYSQAPRFMTMPKLNFSLAFVPSIHCQDAIAHGIAYIINVLKITEIELKQCKKYM